ncbi:hypothetical protein [Marinobacter caseinilyticus]|uniref:hypothetical protein n=1 Tax=Marinobacter caseinilyticus TaxID=2692195 RepID=UPI001409D154|nr:hypothetical protein [Marinobacter caseinilyticus]
MQKNVTFLITFLMQLLACAFAIFCFWLWWLTLQAIARDELLIEAQTGMRYLLLPLILPILHLATVIDRKFSRSRNNHWRKHQGNFFLLAIVALFALGWLIESQYFSVLEEQGYQACEAHSSGLRSTFIVYTRDMSQCPNQN